MVGDVLRTEIMVTRLFRSVYVPFERTLLSFRWTLEVTSGPYVMVVRARFGAQDFRRSCEIALRRSGPGQTIVCFLYRPYDRLSIRVDRLSFCEKGYPPHTEQGFNIVANIQCCCKYWSVGLRDARGPSQYCRAGSTRQIFESQFVVRTTLLDTSSGGTEVPQCGER